MALEWGVGYGDYGQTVEPVVVAQGEHDLPVQWGPHPVTYTAHDQSWPVRELEHRGTHYQVPPHETLAQHPQQTLVETTAEWQQLRMVEAQHQQVAQKLRAVKKQHRQVAQQLGVVQAQHQQETQQLRAVQAQRQEEAHQLRAVQAQRQEEAQQLGVVQVQHQQETQQLGAVQAQRQQEAQQLSVVQAQRQQEAQQLSVVQAQRQQEAQQLGVVQAQRQQETQQLSVVQAQRQQEAQQLRVVQKKHQQESQQLGVIQEQRQREEKELHALEARCTGERHHLMWVKPRCQRTLAHPSDCHAQIEQDARKRSPVQWCGRNYPIVTGDTVSFSWERFDLYTSALLESAYKVWREGGPGKVSWNIGFNIHEYDFVTMLQMDTRTKMQHPIDRLGEPCNWGLQVAPGGGATMFTKLHVYQNEFDQVKNAVRASTWREVAKVEGIWNPRLWAQYAAAAKKTGNERWLFHGAESTAVQKICQEGFDRMLAGSNNGTSYGCGCYFARDAALAERYLRGGNEMILATVLVGSHTMGSSGAKTPPPLPNGVGTYDSTTSYECCNPGIFVTYRDWQAYPMYIITFKDSSR